MWLWLWTAHCAPSTKHGEICIFVRSRGLVVTSNSVRHATPFRFSCCTGASGACAESASSATQTHTAQSARTTTDTVMPRQNNAACWRNTRLLLSQERMYTDRCAPKMEKLCFLLSCDCFASVYHGKDYMGGGVMLENKTRPPRGSALLIGVLPRCMRVERLCTTTGWRPPPGKLADGETAIAITRLLLTPRV